MYSQLNDSEHLKNSKTQKMIGRDAMSCLFIFQKKENTNWDDTGGSKAKLYGPCFAALVAFCPTMQLRVGKVG